MLKSQLNYNQPILLRLPTCQNITYLLNLLDHEVIQVFKTYMDASRHLFSVCLAAGGFELLGMISPAFQMSTTLSEKKFFSSNIKSTPMLEKFQ